MRLRQPVNGCVLPRLPACGCAKVRLHVLGRCVARVPTTPGSLNAVITVEDWVLVRRGGGSSICGPPLFRISARHHTANGVVSGKAEVVRRTPILW